MVAAEASKAMLAQALTETGGDLSDEERAWADRILGTAKRGKRSP